MGIVLCISGCLKDAHLSSKDFHLSDNIDAAMELVTIQAMKDSGNNNIAMSPDHIRALGQNDQLHDSDKCSQPGISFQTFSNRTWNLWLLRGAAPTQYWERPNIVGWKDCSM